VIVLPEARDEKGLMSPERLTVSAELRAAVLAHLDARRLLGAALDVRGPQYVWVTVEATLRVADRSDPAVHAEVQQRVEAAVSKYLDPLVGGPQENGWPFGRELHVSEVYALLQRVPSVDFVEDVQLHVRQAATNSPIQNVTTRVALPPDGVVCSDPHRISVT
jgi:hypothetical protein